MWTTGINPIQGKTAAITARMINLMAIWPVVALIEVVSRHTPVRAAVTAAEETTVAVEAATITIVVVIPAVFSPAEADTAARATVVAMVVVATLEEEAMVGAVAIK